MMYEGILCSFGWVTLSGISVAKEGVTYFLNSFGRFIDRYFCKPVIGLQYKNVLFVCLFEWLSYAGNTRILIITDLDKFPMPGFNSLYCMSMLAC